MNTSVAQEQQKEQEKEQEKEQDLTPQEQFTGKNLTRFGGAGLIRRFFTLQNVPRGRA